MKRTSIKRNIAAIGMTILTIVFVVLKLINVTDWSWWLVLSPVIIFAILVVVLIILISW
jgi:hypothetical protein